MEEKLKEETQVPPDLKETPKQRWLDRKIILTASFILAIILISGIALFTKNKNTVSYKSTVASVTPTPDPTANWKTYEISDLGFSIKLPPYYQVISSAAGMISFGFSLPGDKPHPYITITNYKTIDYGNFNPCFKDPSNPTQMPTCLNGVVSGNAKEDISDIYLDGKLAKNFYTAAGADSDMHYVQTDSPVLQVQMYIAGGGMERDFKKILSTFKFTSIQVSPSPSASPSGEQVFCTQEAKLCPDGKTYVSRHGPKCDFDLCPK